MKYIYKINYGGTSSISSSSKIFNAVDELNNLFEIIIKHKSNYKDYKDSQFLEDLIKENSDDLNIIYREEELLYNIYNDDYLNYL